MTRAQRGNWYKFCSDPLDKIEHYEEALAEGFKGWCIHHRLEIQPDGTRMSREELKDKGLYYGRPASELVFMKVGEHHSLHNKGNNHSEETRRKMSESLKGRTLSEEHRQKLSEANKGKHQSEESRRKMSESHKGKHLTAETRQKLSEALSGENHPLFGKHLSEETRRKLSVNNGRFWKGKHLSEEHRHRLSEALKGKQNWTKDSHWWNNGISNKRSRECPGPEWKRGRIRFK